MAMGYSDRVSKELGRQGGGAWGELMLKAKSYGAGLCDLGQGKPDFPGSAVARKTAAAFCIGDIDGGVANQYCQVQGGSELLDAVPSFYKREFGVDVDRDNCIITAGGTQAIMTVFLTLLQEGDESLIIEPFFPWYPSATRICGAKAVYVKTTLENRFWPTIAEIEAKITERTKLLIFSNPSNPAGRVVTRAELEDLVRLCARRGIFLVSDEAYEGQCWENGIKHVKTMSVLPDLSKDILITLGTASKLNSLTGWRVGWIVAPKSISAGCKLVHSHETFCAPVPLQRAIAESLDPERGDIQEHMREATELMRDNAERLTTALETLLPGVKAFRPGGGYFVIADISCFTPPGSPVCNGAAPSGDGKFTDVAFVEWMLSECMTFCMPGSMFFNMDGGETTTPYVRFAISKSKAVVDEAISRMRKAVSATE